MGHERKSLAPGTVREAKSEGLGMRTWAPARLAASPIPETPKALAGSLMGLSVTVT